MKSAEEITQILEAYDLTGSFRDAAELAGCSHDAVQHYVRAREEQRLTADVVRRAMLIAPFLAKVEEWVERSRGKLRADVAHRKLVDLGWQGSERTTRRAVAEVKAHWRAGRVRVHRPWVPQPGMWMQYDFGAGPPVLGHAEPAALRVAGLVAVPSLGRTPRAGTDAEAAFLALGDGAALWLTEACPAGASRVQAKVAEAVSLANRRASPKPGAL